ncbi:MAG TPA: ABC transporter permease [Thermoanaerobaculia bacterium]|nr:ABC transporter permease [Thermoanaerobaculia bacterium]
MIGRDIRYFLRTLGRQPGFALTVILSLAVGIGANTVMFGVARTILYDHIAARDPESLVLLEWVANDFPAESLSGTVSFDGGNATSTSFSYPAYEAFSRANTLSSLVAFSSIERLNVSIQGEPTMARGAMVSTNYYDALGVRPAIGRLQLSDGEAVISYGYWRSQFAGDSRIVGRALVLNGKPFTIAGVEPRGFRGTLDVGSEAQVTVPLSAQKALFGVSDAANPSSWWLQLMGRRRGSDGQIASEMTALLQPQVHGPKIRVNALPGSRGLGETRSNLRRPVLILAYAVALVLLIACTNVAGLLLARATSRRKEISVRMSLGASRGALIRQLLIESVTLSLLGGAAGVALAYWIRPLVPFVLASPGPQVDIDVPLDLRVLLFTIGVCVLTGIAFGLVPALRATKIELKAAVRNRFANVLMMIQIAVSVILMIGCGLFVGSLAHLEGGERGFNANNLLLFRLDPTLNGYEGARLVQFYDNVLARVRAVPGVRIATPTRYALLSGSSAIGTLFVEGKPADEKQRDYVWLHTVGEQFLDAMGIPVIAGRGLKASDDESAPKVVLISQNTAKQFFPNENPIGRRIGFSKNKAADHEIVGIVRDARYTSMKDEMPPTVIFPYRQQLDKINSMSFVVRTTGDPRQLADDVRAAVRRIDPNVPLFNVRTQTEQIDESMRHERALAALATFFGIVALVLSCIGLYGLMSYIAARRTRETGVRIALGARGRDIAWNVLRRALLLVLGGVVIGTALALVLTKYVQSLVYGIAVNDAATIAGAIAVMVAVTLVASWFPARRASRTDPVAALRAE